MSKLEIGIIILIVFIISIAICTCYFSESQNVASTMFSGLLAFIGSMFLGYVAIWQNDKLSNQNERLNELNQELIDLNRNLEDIQMKTWMISSQRSIPFLRMHCGKVDYCIVDKVSDIDTSGYITNGFPDNSVTLIKRSAAIFNSDVIIKKHIGLTIENYSDARIETIRLYIIDINNIKIINNSIQSAYCIIHNTFYDYNILDSGDKWNLDLTLFYTTHDNNDDNCCFTLYLEYKTITGYVRYQQISVMCSSGGSFYYQTSTSEKKMEPIIGSSDAVKQPYNFGFS